MNSKKSENLKVNNKFKYPLGISVESIREKTFPVYYTATDLNRQIYPYDCIDGWYVLDSVKTEDHVIVTYGKPSAL